MRSSDLDNKEALVLFDRLKTIDIPPSKEEFESILNNKAALLPLLLTEVDSFIESPSHVEGYGETYIRHTLAIFLLAHFREKSFYPKIIQLISKPGDQIINLTGEVFSEALGRILASVFDGDLSPLQDVIENKKLNPWIRAGALDTFMVLWKEDVLSREQVISYLRELLLHKLEKEPSYVWDAVALIAYDLHPKELERDLLTAIKAKLIEPVVLSEESLADCLAQPFQDALKHKENVVDGFIKAPCEELSWWLYPDRKLLQKGKDYESLDVPIVDKDVIPGERVAPMGWRSATVVRGSKKLGRNEPCFCGSGKKYKKCCLNQ
ncbi:MAG: hypothetical protein COB41_01750 [Proteobacteria bacterium]|nr:MAG: hypothetical protein COB41_01750 [Pseudomonadota bacterium]